MQSHFVFVKDAADLSCISDGDVRARVLEEAMEGPEGTAVEVALLLNSVKASPTRVSVILLRGTSLSLLLYSSGDNWF